MRGLIYKDLYLLKNRLIFSVLSIIVFGSFSIGLSLFAKSPLLYKLMAASTDMMIVMFLAIINYDFLMKTDQGKAWGFYGISLPEGSRGIVAAKYMTVFILYFISYALCVVNDLIYSLISGTAIDMSIFTLVIILFNLFLNLVEMPIAFRFGTDKSSVIRILITMIIVVIVLIYLLFGNIEWLMAEDGMIKSIIRVFAEERGPEGLSEEVQKLLNKMTYINIIEAAVATHFVVLAYYISYKISCKVYRKGVLRDDI